MDLVINIHQTSKDCISSHDISCLEQSNQKLIILLQKYLTVKFLIFSIVIRKIRE